MLAWFVALVLLSTLAGAATDAAELQGPGGGEFVFKDDGPHVTDEQRAAIWREIEHNVARLQAEGKLPPATLVHPLFGWPLRTWNGLTDPGYHGVSNFVDQNAAFPGALLDYNCGNRTYDTLAGYNHAGIDYFTWPFGWNKMDAGQVAVVAAAPGTMVYRADGYFDRSCASNGNPWNAVYVRHADSSIAWYGHLKNGSLTPKGVGATVATGEYLGIVGSSGNSTGPHLHLEVYDSSTVHHDPYAGPCNAKNPDTWWLAQRPYYDSAINRVMTGSAPVSFGICPAPDTPNEKRVFGIGEPIYFTAFYRDQLSTQTSQYRIRRPDGSIYDSWSHASPVAHYAASYWYWYDTGLAPGEPEGLWSFEVTFQGQTAVTRFIVGSAPAGDVPLLTVGKAGSNLTLSWNPSCLTTDSDYEIYQGTLGNWTSHEAILCGTGGATTHSLSIPADDVYFLIVPTNTVFEGSYGRDSASVERVPGITTCRAQDAISCP